MNCLQELPVQDRKMFKRKTTVFLKLEYQLTHLSFSNLLLGSQGIDLPRIVQKLDHISTKQTFEPLKPTVDTDVPSYLQNETQNIIVSIIEENFRKVDLLVKMIFKFCKFVC